MKIYIHGGENFSHLYHRCVSVKFGISKSRIAKTDGSDWKNMGMIWLNVSIPRKSLNAFGTSLFLSDVFRVCFDICILPTWLFYVNYYKKVFEYHVTGYISSSLVHSFFSSSPAHCIYEIFNTSAKIITIYRTVSLVLPPTTLTWNQIFVAAIRNA